MRIEGEDTEGVYAGIEYLGKVARGENPPVGSKVLVVGGGNTAIDASRTSLRAGADCNNTLQKNKGGNACK